MKINIIFGISMLNLVGINMHIVKFIMMKF